MEYLLKASAIVAIFYFCYTLFLQRDTFFESNRWFLLIGLITAFCVPFIVIPKYIVRASAFIQDFIFVEGSSSTNTIESSFDIFQIIAVVYIIGVIFFLVRFLIQFYSLGLLLFQNKKQQYRHYTFVETFNDVSPFSFFKWIVFNPKQFSETELKQILTHEKVHARQWHSVDILISQVTSIVLWFNPFIWLYKNNLQQNLEFIADQNVNKKTDCKKSYQHLLLKTSLPNYELALANNFYNSLTHLTVFGKEIIFRNPFGQVKKRIVMLHKNKSKNRNYWKFTLILPLLALFIMSFNTKEIIIANDLENSKKIFTNKTLEDGDIEKVTITKDFTSADFKKAKEKFDKLGVTLKFSGIKRNKDNEIVEIKVEFKTKEGNSGNYQANSDKPIKPFNFHYNIETGEVGIGGLPKEVLFGKNKGYSFFSKDGTHKIHTSGKGKNTFFFKSDDNENDYDDHDNVFIIKKNGKVYDIKSVDSVRVSYNISNLTWTNDDNDDEIIFITTDDGKVHEVKKIHKDKKILTITSDDIVIDIDSDHDIEINGDTEIIIIIKDKDGNIVKRKIIGGKHENVWITESDKTFKVEAIGKGTGNKLFFTNSGEKPLYILDGKEVSKKKLDDVLDNNDIESVTVLKGDAAMEKYGKKAKDGVILITTKKKE